MGAFTSPAVRRDAPACWFPLAHAEAITAHPGLKLVGVTDVDPAAAARAAAAHGNPPCFEDVAALLTATRPELLCVATRTTGRAGIIAQAVEQGVRALHVEKPLCNSMDELDGLSALLARPDVHLTLGAIRRHMAPYRAALSLVEDGAIGTLREVQVQFGETALCWSHPHSLDLLLFAAGDRAVLDVSATLGPVETGAHARDVLNDPLVHDITVRFEGDLIGRVTRVPAADLVLAGSSGAIAVEADGHRLRQLSLAAGAGYPAWTALPKAVAEPQAGTLAALAQLVDCLEGRADALAANARLKRDVLMGQRLLFAALQSAAEGSRPVRPADVDQGWHIHALTNGRPA